MMIEIFILPAGNKEILREHLATEQTRQMNYAAELKDNKIVLNEQIVLLSKINGETAEEQTDPLLPTKILTAIIMSIVIFTVPRKNPKKMAAVMIYLPERKKKKAKKIIIAIICVVVAIIIGVVAFVAIMLSRINYKPVDTTSYVEQPSDAPTWDVISDNAITNILLLGVDRSEDGTAQRSDTMMLISINSKTKNLNMVSFLRDLYVEIPTAGKNKINAAYTIGSQSDVGEPGLTMQTIENNFRINIDHYVEIDFENFINLIDAMGGIDIEMTQDEVDYMSSWYYGEYGQPISLQVGMNHLDGKGALTFARIRKLDSDFGRTGRQRQVMIAIFDKFKTLNPAQMTSVFYNYAQYITTDLSSSDILSLATQAGTILGYEVQTSHVPEEGLYTEIDYNLVPDLPGTCASLREFLYGSDSSSSSAKNTN